MQTHSLASFKSFHPLYPNFLISRTSSFLNGQPFDLADAFFLIFIADSALILSSMLKLFLLSYALSPYTLSISYLLAASFTRGPNFFSVSCTFPLVILNDTTFFDFSSTDICSFTNSFFSRFHLSSM